jgi:hypothetical protein
MPNPSALSASGTRASAWSKVRLVFFWIRNSAMGCLLVGLYRLTRSATPKSATGGRMLTGPGR